MIIQTPYKAGDTVSMKLSSGEEIVGRLEEETVKGYKVSKPLMLTATPQGVGLAPFMFTVDADTKIEINGTSVVGIAKTAEDAAKQYIESTTGLSL